MLRESDELAWAKLPDQIIYSCSINIRFIDPYTDNNDNH